METRRYDIDWLRVLAVLVLFPFHTAGIFNPWDFHLKNDELSVAVGVFAAFVDQRHMPIFFLISGAASWYVLKKKSGGRPRLSVFRSSKHIYVQLIDDRQGATLAAASSLDKDLKGKIKTGADVSAAAEVGKLIAERAKTAGVSEVVFDRGGYLYHGRVKALADAAREGGLSF